MSVLYFMLLQLLPGVKIVIANPETRGQCADSHLGEVILGCVLIKLILSIQMCKAVGCSVKLVYFFKSIRSIAIK